MLLEEYTTQSYWDGKATSIGSGYYPCGSLIGCNLSLFLSRMPNALKPIEHLSNKHFLAAGGAK